MTPYELTLILHIDVGIEPKDAPILNDTLKRFIDDGLVQQIGVSTSYETTPKGKAFCEALQRTPLPIQAWHINYPADTVVVTP